MRKKFFICMSVLFVILVSFGIYFVQAEAEGNYHPYYPLKPGNQWIYQMTFPDNSSFIRTVGVSAPINRNDHMVIMINKQPIAEVQFKMTDQGLFKVKEVTGDGIQNIEPMQMILPKEIKPGMTWNWESEDKKNKETGKIVGFEKISMKIIVLENGLEKESEKEYDAVLVEYNGVYGGSKYTEKSWFVKNIGCVKTVNVTDGKTTTITMKDYNFLEDQSKG